MCHDSCGFVQRWNVYRNIKQAENETCSRSYTGNEVSVDAMAHAWERKFVFCS